MGIEKKNFHFILNKSTLVEGEVCKSKNSFCRVFPINAASDASIVNSSIERKVTPMGSLLQVNPPPIVPIDGTGEEALRLGINNTKPCYCYKIYLIFFFLIGIGINKNGWDNKDPSRSYFGYP